MFYKIGSVSRRVIIFPIIKTPPCRGIFGNMVTRQGGTGVLLLKQKIDTSYDVGNWND